QDRSLRTVLSWLATGCTRPGRILRWASHQRITRLVTQAAITTATMISVITAIVRSTPVTTCTTLATCGPILLAARPPPMISTTAATPGAWLRECWQHDRRLHMTGRLAVGSVKHATHLFL